MSVKNYVRLREGGEVMVGVFLRVACVVNSKKSRIPIQI